MNPVNASRAAVVPPPGGAATRRSARRPIAVIVSRFPLITETFILREIEELERQGQPVVLVPLIREQGRVTHREAARWIERMLYVPFLSADVIATNLRTFRRQPRGYVQALIEAVSGSAHSANVLLRTIALFPKTVALGHKLAELDVQHVHAHFATYPAGAALVLSLLGGPSFSFTAHAHDIYVPWRRTSIRRKVEQARFVRAIGLSGRERLLACCGAEFASKIEVIHVGVRPDDYQDAGASRVGTVPRLLCVAALKPYKGLAVLLEACQRVKQAGRRFHCDIVGDGPLRPRIEHLRASMHLEDSITLHGALRQDQVTSLVTACDIALAPSIVAPDGQMDGIPVALMEAMGAGRPVVASRLAGVPELVDDGVNGLLTEPGNAAELAAAIQRLLDDPAFANRLGRRARKKVAAEFRLDRSVRTLLDRLDANNPGIAEHNGHWRKDLEALLPGVAVGIRRVRDRLDSTVLEVIAAKNGHARDLIVKVHHEREGDPRSAEARAAHEFAVLECLQAMGSVPRVLNRSRSALLFEPCRGTLLVECVQAARLGGARHRAALLDAVERTGTWLRNFQRHAVAGGSAGAALASLVAMGHADLDAAVASCLVTASERSQIELRLRDLAQAVEASITASTPAVGHHGDFWPGNIFVTERDVSVIDFEGFRDGLPYEDVGYFLVQLQMFFRHVPFAPYRRKLERAFLRGYCGNRVDTSALALCRLVKSLQVLASDRSPDQRHSGALRRMALHA